MNDPGKTPEEDRWKTAEARVRRLLARAWQFQMAGKPVPPQLGAEMAAASAAAEAAYEATAAEGRHDA
jgi:hypothetical protein